MKKKSLLFCLSIIASAMLFAFVGCRDSGGEDSSDIIRGEISDVILTVNDMGYDFHENLSFVDENGKKISFTCDTAGVKFGEAGQYVVTYQVGESTYERIVYIYGEPSITTLNQTISHEAVVTGDFSSCVVAKDTFGKELPVTFIGQLSYDENGVLKTGAQAFSFSATDTLGNQATKEISLNVSPSQDAFLLSSIEIDYAQPYFTVEIGDRQVQSIYCDGTPLNQTFYIVNNGFLMLTPEFAKTFGKVNGKALYINFNTGSVQAALTITDNQPTAYKVVGTVDEKGFDLLDKIMLPRLEQTNASIQDVEFKYYVEYKGEKVSFTESSIVPEFGGEYRFIAEIYKDDALAETLTQTFTVSHYARDLIGINSYVALGSEYDYSVLTDLTGLNITYNVIDTEGILAVNGNKFIATKEGTAKIEVNINNGEIARTVDFEVVDFGNTVGGSLDIAKTLSFWTAIGEDNQITYENKVNDLRTTALQYSFNALKSTGAVALDGKLIEVAKRLGYKYLTFTVMLDNESERLELYARDNGDESKICAFENGGRWQYQSIALEELANGADLVFSGGGANVHLAKVEFVGADISDYASAYLAASSTAGKSIDLINGDLLGKIVQTVCNTNNTMTYTDTGMDKNKTDDNGDYFSFTREGYVSTYGRVENSLYISSEWIMAAKKQGYNVLGIWVGKHEGYSMMKRSADGTLNSFNNNGKEWHAGASDKWGFISLDITSFEEGDTVIISLSGSGACVAGITFRTMDYAVPNLKIN